MMVPFSSVHPPAGIVSPHITTWPAMAPWFDPLRCGYSVTVKIVPDGNDFTVTPCRGCTRGAADDVTASERRRENAKGDVPIGTFPPG